MSDAHTDAVGGWFDIPWLLSDVLDRIGIELL